MIWLFIHILNSNEENPKLRQVTVEKKKNTHTTEITHSKQAIEIAVDLVRCTEGALKKYMYTQSK